MLGGAYGFFPRRFLLCSRNYRDLLPSLVDGIDTLNLACYLIAGELAAIPAPKQSFSEGKMLVLGGNELPVPPASISSR
jgi:hypothetical protein